MIENSRIFVLGDVISMDEEKTAERALVHAQLVAANVFKILKGEKMIK
jgi:NADH dehydrogenase FAD-containing subunit